METVNNTSLTVEKKNKSLIKKTKHFFSKKKSKYNYNQKLGSNTSLVSNKDDSNKTLITTINNDDENSSLKQNKPEIINKEINLKEESVLNKSEIINENDENLKQIQQNINDLDKKVNDINSSFIEKSEIWQSNYSEISERLNSLMGQISQSQKEQHELSNKLNEELNRVKKSILNEAQKSLYLKSDIEEIKANSEKTDNENKIMKKESEEVILQQKTEIEALNYKLKDLQEEYKSIKEKVIVLSTPSIEDSTPKKIDINNCDADFIKYIVKCVQEKIEQQYKFKETEAAMAQRKELINTLDVKINALNEKIDEFQIYQLSREVELHRMKIKLDESMVQFNQTCGVQLRKINEERDEFIKKLNNENKKVKQYQFDLYETISNLESTVNTIKSDVTNQLDEQQKKIESINKSAELLQKKNEINDNSSIEKSIENNVIHDILDNSMITEKYKDVQHNIDTINDEIKMLGMENKVMTTNISLLWDDVRTIKTFINQYDMNDKIKKNEANEELSEIYNQINDLKKKINDGL